MLHTHGGYSVDVADDGAITVQPGEWVSKYCMAIYHDYLDMENRFGKMDASGSVASMSSYEIENIEINDVIYDIVTHNHWLKSGGNASAKKKTALQLVDQFAKRTGPAAFTQISRADVAAGLRARVLAPKTINQGQAGLCPSASVVFIEARDRPSQYVKFVTDLYEMGTAKLRNWTVSPKHDLKKHLPSSIDIHVADWIPMASIRDSENWFFDYQQINKGSFGIFRGGGSSSMEMSNWLRKAGYTDVIDKTSVVMAKGKANLLDAQTMRQNNYKIILRINADILSLRKNQWDNDNWNYKPGGNHVVVLTSKINISQTPQGEMVDFKVFTWGSRRSVMPVGATQLKLSVYLQYHYGFVAAKF